MEGKLYFKNAYFIIGNAYSGKSTMIKMLADKYNGVHLEENYHDRYTDNLNWDEFPYLSYTKNLVDWHDFIRRTPDEYEKWINGVSKECEKIELNVLKELTKESDKLIFVDTNISIETLKKVAPLGHVLVMLTDNMESVNRFFERSDREKQFLYRLIMEESDPKKALDNFRECLIRINSKENYDKFLNSGFKVLLKDNTRTVDETLKIVEEYFKLSNGE